MGSGHPERPDRLRVIYEELRGPAFEGGLVWHEAPDASVEQIERAHPASHIRKVRELSLGGGGRLDPDTAVNERSWAAATKAAGAGIAAVDLVLGEGPAAVHGERVFVAVRPPGHHAEASRAMGFCLFNNIVVAAHEARSRGVEKVLIVDWDVHHGNGTQALVEKIPDIHFVSLHQWPLYPGTGREDERGVGNVWNLPRPPGRPPGEYVRELRRTIDAAVRDFEPGLVLISAGYDAMLGDPLAGFTLEAKHFVELTRHLLDLGQPTIAFLEGGYNLENLRAGVRATIETLG